MIKWVNANDDGEGGDFKMGFVEKDVNRQGVPELFKDWIYCRYSAYRWRI